MGPENSHVNKITYEPLIETALFVTYLMGANPLLGHWKGWEMKVSTFIAQPFQWLL